MEDANAADITSLSLQVDKLKFDFLLSVIIIGIVLFLTLVLAIILYCWVYTLEKKLKKQKKPWDTEVDYRIRRPQIREEFSRTTNTPQTNQNPYIAGNNNFMAVVDDFKRTSNAPNTPPSRYPNYIADNSNFAY